MQNEANVTTTPPVVSHEDGDTKVTTVVTTTIHDDAQKAPDANSAPDGHSIGAGTTSADYAEADAAARDAATKSAQSDKDKEGSNDKSASATNKEDKSQPEESLSIAPYLINTIDAEHRQRVASIVDKAFLECGVDRKKLLAELMEEELRDSQNLFEAAVEIMYRASQASPTNPPAIVGKERGRITIRNSTQPSNLANTVVLVGTTDGSLRALFYNTTGKVKPDVLVKNAPDAVAEPLLAAAVDWLQISLYQPQATTPQATN